MQILPLKCQLWGMAMFQETFRCERARRELLEMLLCILLPQDLPFPIMVQCICRSKNNFGSVEKDFPYHWITRSPWCSLSLAFACRRSIIPKSNITTVPRSSSQALKDFSVQFGVTYILFYWITIVSCHKRAKKNFQYAELWPMYL